MQHYSDSSAVGDESVVGTGYFLSRRRLMQAGAIGLLVGATGPSAGEESESDTATVSFETLLEYNLKDVTSFTNQPVTSGKRWGTGAATHASGVTLESLGLVLDSELTFEHLQPAPNDDDPITWQFGDLTEGAEARVYANAVDPPQTTYEPGFDAGFTVDQSTFSEPGVQTVTATMTPREDVGRLEFRVFTEDAGDLVDARVVDATGEGIEWIDADQMSAYIIDPDVDKTYSWTVQIAVEPLVSAVEYRPRVPFEVASPVASDRSTGYGVTHPIDDLGSWAWSTANEQVWYWEESEARIVNFVEKAELSNRPPTVEGVGADPATLWPPNNKERDVTVTVDASDPDGNIEEVVYEVVDEYGEFDTTITTAVDLTGELHHEQVIPLEAARAGGDRDGRSYAIHVTVGDSTGETDTSEVTVTVPHDQR